MHRKCSIITAAMLMTTLIFTGCSNFKVGNNVYKKLYDHYSNVTSYKAECVVTVYSGQTQNVYTMRQYYQSPDKLRTEMIDSNGIVGMVSVLQGNKAVITSAWGNKTEIHHTRPAEPDYMQLSTFFDIYYKDRVVREDADENGENIVLTAQTGSSNIYRHTAILHAKSKSLQPISLELAGSDGNLYTRIEYKSFEIGKEMDEALFSF